MPTLSQGPRLNARTTHRIHRGVKQVALVASANGLQFQGRDLSSEAVISAVLIEFLKLSHDEQKQFLEYSLKELENELSDVAKKTSKTV